MKSFDVLAGFFLVISFIVGLCCVDFKKAMISGAILGVIHAAVLSAIVVSAVGVKQAIWTFGIWWLQAD
jgi:hypothetical protein